jgi:RING finger protein 113A
MDSKPSPQLATDPTPAVSLFKKRTGKSNIRKRAATPPPASDSSYSSSEDESGARVKRRKKNTGAVTASSNTNNSTNTDFSATKYEAERSTTIKSSNDATKASNWYDENTSDALSTKKLLGSTRANGGAGSEAGDGTYKGLANATKFIQKNPDAPNRAVGPVKAPTNIRTVTTTDFAADVCKDYKQTGFCGFGDSCKFVHAREDYKQGWQLDKEWENVTKGKKVAGTKFASADRKGAEEEEVDDSMLENIPFACIICREKYKDPIVTRCGHYFCEACALKRYRKDPSCEACGSGTGGVFNVARGLKKLLERKRERARKGREAAIEAGEEVSEDEEEE